jgi:hypothetical protein
MESHSDSEFDFPPIELLFQKRNKERGYTDTITLEGNTQQKKRRINKEAEDPLQPADGSGSSVSSGDQDRLEDMATSGRHRSEIPESPCGDGHIDGSHAPQTATVTTRPQSQDGTDSTIDHHCQVHGSNGLSSSSRMSQRQVSVEGRGCHVSQRAEGSPHNRSITDDKLWGSASHTSCLGVFGQRQTSHGPEYRCLVVTWLRPEDDIAKKQIRQYHRRLVVQPSAVLEEEKTRACSC